MKTLEFFYDPISPYAMLGFHALPEALVGVSAQVRYTPVLFGAMLRANDSKGPAEIATKRDWTFRHVHWLAKCAGITLVDPAQHLPGAKRLFAEFGKPGGQPIEIKIKQVLRHTT